MIALQNYDWLIRSHELADAELAWDTGTLVWGENCAAIGGTGTQMRNLHSGILDLPNRFRIGVACAECP